MTPLLVAILALSGSVMLDLSSWSLLFKRLGLWATKARVRAASWRKACHAGLPFALQRFLRAGLVLRLVQRQDLVGGLVQSLGPVAQFLVGAAALLAGVAGQLDAVDGEHVAPDQALGIAGHQHLGKERLDLIRSARPRTWRCARGWAGCRH